MRVGEACVRLFSLLHRANFVSVSPHPGRFLHFFWLSLSLSGSLRACFFYIRSVDEERKLSFPFFFLFGLSLRSFVRSKRCAGEWTFQPRVDFRVHSHAYSRSAVHWADATAENQTVIHFGLIGVQRAIRPGSNKLRRQE